MSTWTEMSCGNCGGAKHRIRAQLYGGNGSPAKDIALVCCKCGSVTHLVVKPEIAFEWGREKEGEKHDGLLCTMEWPGEVEDPRRWAVRVAIKRTLCRENPDWRSKYGDAETYLDTLVEEAMMHTNGDAG